MAVTLLNTSIIAKEMQTKVTERMGDWFEAEFKAKANAASRRTRLIRSHGHTYTYARYQNTGELSRNLKQVKKGDKVVVDAGTRANYTSGYHGMYFLVEKKGMEDVKTTLKKGANYANSMKL